MTRTKAGALRAGLLALLVIGGIAPAGATQTPPGTTISNTATASYTDSNGNALTATSNTVSTVVQNAPSLTSTNGGNQTAAPGANVTDTFTLTNTGNNSGDFQVTASALTGTGSGTSITSYTVTLPSGSTYNGSNSTTNGASAPTTAQTFTSLAALNTFLGSVNVPSGSAATVAVLYSSGTSTTGNTVTDTLTADIAYPATGGAAAATSAVATSAPVATIQNDARLDIQKTSTQNTTSASPNYGDITYTIAVNNGGSSTAHYVQALEQPGTGLATAGVTTGSAPGGILIVDQVPSFNSTPLALAVSPTVTYTRNVNGFPNDSSENAVVYCTTAATPASGWSTSCPTGTQTNPITYIAVLVYGGSLGNSLTGGDGLQPNPTGSSGASGSGPTVTAPALTLSFTIVPPTGTGSGVAGSVKNVANSVFENNSGTPAISGPNGTCTDANSATALSCVTTDEENTTSNTSGGKPGASIQTSNAAIAAYAVLVDPSGFPAAVGASGASGCTTASNNCDFTDWAFADGSSPTVTSTAPGPTITGSTTTTADTMCVPLTVENAGNLTDTAITLKATAPGAGWSAEFFSDATCSTTPLSTAGSTTTTSAISLASGATQTDYVKYTAPVGTPSYTAEQALITATGTANGTTANTNTTYDNLYDGFIALVKQTTITSSGCPSGVTVTTVCPGGVITYSITVENVAMAATATGSNEPASALLTNSTAGIVVTDDGTASGSWFAAIPSVVPTTYVTSGVNAVPTLTVGGVPNTSSVCTYYYGNPFGAGSSTFTAPSYTLGSLSNGPSKLSCILGGAAGSATVLPAGSTSSSSWMVFSFNVTVRAN